MKMMVPVLIVGILVLSGLGASSLSTDVVNFTTENIKHEQSEVGKDGYTHTVFVEIATAQFCGPCHYWNQNIHNYYTSGNYDFEYVEMIVCGSGGFNDIINDDALAWYDFYGINGFPTTIFDGDYIRLDGNQPGLLSDTLNDCGARAVVDIAATMTVSWLGDATLEVTITIQNNEETHYDGYMRACITEIVSRYNTAYGVPYHFGFLDYAFNQNISINPGGIYTNSIIWNGNDHTDNYGADFGDITPDNIQVTMGVFDDMNGYVDETVKSRIAGYNSPPAEPELDGLASGVVGEEYDYTFVSTDPDNDDVYYYIDWGDDTTDTTDFYNSEVVVTVSHTWNETGDYIIKAKAVDEHDGESDWGTLEVTMPISQVKVYQQITRFLQYHPNMCSILRHLMRL